MIPAHQMNGRHMDRYKVNQRVLVVNSLCNQLLGNVVNMHEEGFMLIGNNVSLSDRSIYQLMFQFSSPVLEKNKITLGAECLWVRKTSGKQCWAGFQIIDISDADKKAIALLCAQI